jgi:hypothetical protein
MVSTTDFTTIALALADDSVKNATAGDFVKITGDIYLIIKTSPTVSADLVSVPVECFSIIAFALVGVISTGSVPTPVFT